MGPYDHRFCYRWVWPRAKRKRLGLLCLLQSERNYTAKIPLTLLHKGMPVLRSDADVNDNDPKKAASLIVERVKDRSIPFHWFRNILKTPTWYVQVVEEIRKLNPNIELLDAPAFFELYRIYLEQNPKAAKGEL